MSDTSPATTPLLAAYFRPAICGTPSDPTDDIGSIVASIRYVANLVGTQHVGLGSDFDGVVATAIDTTGLVHITDRLLREGFGRADIVAVAGGNVARLLRAVLPGR